MKPEYRRNNAAALIHSFSRGQGAHPIRFSNLKVKAYPRTSQQWFSRWASRKLIRNAFQTICGLCSGLHVIRLVLTDGTVIACRIIRCQACSR